MENLKKVGRGLGKTIDGIDSFFSFIMSVIYNVALVGAVVLGGYIISLGALALGAVLILIALGLLALYWTTGFMILPG
ncbi:hypothetical protein FOS14_07295 [Skermania sp. ID1734]|uniref:hypothetical protein n=1 Tax=Skermania sp. ID1734 TaxID=2597516 RepID=UPI00117F7883|nr:hypothetical protein [Skermania sp. ID1734]TSE00802.1 hypothetical protein FOS14_07295 [Skermania sp. ID1734]